MRKQVQGPIRDKQKTRQKILNSVGEIVINKGFTHLKISAVATHAGVDKKLIYQYFGSFDDLIDEYLLSRDCWTKVYEEDSIPDNNISTKNLIKNILHSQSEALLNNKELQKIILWEVSEYHPLLRQCADRREEKGGDLFKKLVDPKFGENAKLFRGIMALLLAGNYYLNIHDVANGSLFCGLDIKKERDRDTLREAVNFIIDAAFKEKTIEE